MPDWGCAYCKALNLEARERCCGCGLEKQEPMALGDATYQKALQVAEHYTGTGLAPGNVEFWRVCEALKAADAEVRRLLNQKQDWGICTDANLCARIELRKGSHTVEIVCESGKPYVVCDGNVRELAEKLPIALDQITGWLFALQESGGE